MKLSKPATRAHQKAVDLVKSDRPLTIDERIQVLNDWNPAAEHNIGVTGTFFTPMDLARELQIETSNNPNKRVCDLCAGTGRLAFHAWHKMLNGSRSGKTGEIVCVENNPAFIEVGKRVLPEATWIRGDVFEESTYDGLGLFDEVISNPPFGTKAKPNWLYKTHSHYMAAEVAMKIGKRGFFVLPQASLPFTYSGRQHYQDVKNRKYEIFRTKKGVVFEMNCGLDTSQYESEWTGTRITTEIVLVYSERNAEVIKLDSQRNVKKQSEAPIQLELFG